MMFNPNASVPCFSPDNLSPRQRLITETIFVLDTYVTPGICAIGCLGNLLSLFVLTRTRFRQTDGHTESVAHLGLILLAVSDLSYCVVFFPRVLLPTTHSLFEAQGFTFYYQLYGEGLVGSVSLVSTWITVVMAVLRYFSICHPFVSRKWESLTAAKYLYSVTCLVCLVINIPQFLRYRHDRLVMDDTVYYIIDINTKLDHKTSLGLGLLWLRAVVSVFIPGVCLLLSNVGLIQALRRSRRVRRQCYVRESLSLCCRKWITMTLIVIAVGFIVFVFPSELMDFFLEFIRKDNHKTEAFLLARAIANVMQVANFAFNFLLYYVINVHFRNVLCRTCCRNVCRLSCYRYPPTQAIYTSVYSRPPRQPPQSRDRTSLTIEMVAASKNDSRISLKVIPDALYIQGTTRL